MACLPLKTSTTPVGNAGLKRKHEGTTIKGDLPAEDLLEMRSSPFQNEKRVTMEQKSEGIESTRSQCCICVHQELATLKEEVKEADAARKSQSNEFECLKKQNDAGNIRLEELLKLHHMSRPRQI
ncbi:hypothetical protein EJB05_23186, partial [Eragrostis curvula]